MTLVLLVRTNFGSVRRYVAKAGWQPCVGIAGAAIIVTLAIFAPLFTRYDPIALDLASGLQPPSMAHPFGTDSLGRDILSRVLYASRIDLQIGTIGVTI